MVLRGNVMLPELRESFSFLKTLKKKQKKTTKKNESRMI